MLLKYEVEPTHESRPHSFAIRKHGAPTLHLAADTDDAAVRWTNVIREAVERNSQVRFKKIRSHKKRSLLLDKWPENVTAKELD